MIKGSILRGLALGILSTCAEGQTGRAGYRTVDLGIEPGITASIAGDFTGDGIPDLVVHLRQEIRIYPGDGKGTFGNPLVTPVGETETRRYPHAAAAGDFDRDGKLDLFAFQRVFLGNGDGTLRPLRLAIPIGIEDWPQIGDFNKDGIPDLAGVARAPRRSYQLLLGSADGQFCFPATYCEPIFEAVPAEFGVAGDVNVDGSADLLVPFSSPTFESVTAHLSVTRERPFPPVPQEAGTYTKTSALRWSPAKAIALGEATGDQWPDLIILKNESVLIAPGQGDGRFGTPQPAAAGPERFSGFADAVFADFNSDGGVDMAYLLTREDGTGEFGIRLGDRKGQFSEPVVLAAGLPAAGVIGMGDWNRDGLPDLIADDGRTLTVSLSVLEVLSAGEMAVRPRWYATTITLNDGRVLVAGGSDGAEGQLYDPTTGRWTLTGSMAAARRWAYSVLLPDGRVLISGDSTLLEVFDPKTGTFLPIGNASTPTGPVVRLGDRIGVLTGHEAPGAEGQSVLNLFDPASGSVRPLGAVEGGVLIPFPDGRLVVIGTSSASIYEVSDTALQQQARHVLGSMLSHRAAALLQDGSILIAGGTSNRVGGLPSFEALLYDPRRASIHRLGSLPEPQIMFGMTLLYNGSVLTGGGYFTHPGVDDYWAEPAIYDPSTETFTPIPGLPQGYAASTLPDGRVLLNNTGAYSGRIDGSAPTALLYSPAARVVSAASYGGRLAPESLATMFGPQLADETGVTLTVRDAAGVERPAALLFTSPSQINFEVPAGTSSGEATFLLHKGGQMSTVKATIAAVAPALFAYEDYVAIGYGMEILPDGSFVTTPPATRLRSVLGLRIWFSMGRVSAIALGCSVPSAACRPPWSMRDRKEAESPVSTR